MAMFSKGLVLQQHKEPAFSHSLVRFVTPQTDALLSEDYPDLPPDQLSVDQLIDIARTCHIVDEQDGKPLYRKLIRAKGKAVAVIADAVDDEPYISSQLAPMLQLREEACGGLALCHRIAQCEKAFVLVYKNITDLETRIPRTLEGYQVVRLRGGYPAESRLNSLELGGGRKLMVGAGALIHFYRAVTQHKRHSTAFITVAGNCVASPMNLEVSLGMSVQQVLERCGLVSEPSRVVCGGPMTGISIIDTENTLITPTTRGILAFREDKGDSHYSCIGCGRCGQVCPSGLNPMYIYRFVENSYFANLRPFDAHLCIGCGTCSYVCPSKLNVAVATKRARQYALDHFIAPPDEEDDDLEA